MKKLFSRIENTFDSQQGFAGKAFVVGRHTVTVEETIAEGEIKTKIKIIRIKMCRCQKYELSLLSVTVSLTLSETERH